MLDKTKGASVTEEQKPLGKAEEDFFPKTDGDSEEAEPLEKEEVEETTDDSEEEADEGESSSTLDEVAASEEDDEGEDLLSEFEQKSKDNVQKRIDKLVAEKKALEEKLAKVEPKTESEPKYTRGQLFQAVKKGIEDGDAALVMDVFEYMTKQTKDELREEYRKEQSKVTESQRKLQEEWNQIREDYSHLSDPKEPEIYPGSRKDLDLNKQDSLIHKLAYQLYSSNNKYHRDGGQRAAIVDALTMILKKKKSTSSKSKSETNLLKKKLAKQKRKTALSTGKSMKSEKTVSKPLSPMEKLEDYVKERKAFQQKASSSL